MAGLVGINSSWIKGMGWLTTSFNDAKTSGIYGVNTPTYNNSGGPELQYGTLIVFNSKDTPHMAQIAFDRLSSKIYYRCTEGSFSGGWKSVG